MAYVEIREGELEHVWLVYAGSFCTLPWIVHVVRRSIRNAQDRRSAKMQAEIDGLDNACAELKRRQDALCTDWIQAKGQHAKYEQAANGGEGQLEKYRQAMAAVRESLEDESAALVG